MAFEGAGALLAEEAGASEIGAVAAGGLGAEAAGAGAIGAGVAGGLDPTGLAAGDVAFDGGQLGLSSAAVGGPAIDPTGLAPGDVGPNSAGQLSVTNPAAGGTPGTTTPATTTAPAGPKTGFENVLSSVKGNAAPGLTASPAQVSGFGSNALVNAAPVSSGLTATSGLPGAIGSVGDFLKENKNLILPGAALGASALTKPKTPDLSSLEAIAAARAGAGSGAAKTTADSLIPTVSTGELPPSAQTALSNATNDAVTAIKSKYANLGLSGSTMEQQEISAAQARAQAEAFSMANALTNTGLAAAGVVNSDDSTAASIYNNIMQTQLQQDSFLSDALAKFAAASATGSAVAPKA